MAEHSCTIGMANSHLSISVWYCQHHQAFWASAHTHSVDADGNMTGHTADSIEFGPFDSSTDVVEWLEYRARRVHALPTLLDDEAAPVLWRLPASEQDVAPL